MTTYHVEMNVTVEVEVNDPNVIDRCVNNEPTPSIAAPEAGWRDQFYPLHDRDDVLEHLAYNAAVNGQDDATSLDGWADLPHNAVQMRVIGADLVHVSETAPR